MTLVASLLYHAVAGFLAAFVIGGIEGIFGDRVMDVLALVAGVVLLAQFLTSPGGATTAVSWGPILDIIGIGVGVVLGYPFGQSLKSDLKRDDEALVVSLFR